MTGAVSIAGDNIYLARPIKRRRRTQAQVGQLDRQIMDVLRADRPQSVRHVFYRMTDPRLPEPVEAEAMPAAVLRNILRTEIEALLPADAVRVARIEEEAARDYFAALAAVTERGA